MTRRPLALQPRAQQINRVNDTSANRPTKAAHERQREIVRQRVLLVLVPIQLHVARHERLLQGLESEQVDRRIGEHPDEPHRQAAVEGGEAVAGPHLLRCVEDEAVASLTAGHRFALHAEFERVEGVDDGLGGHAREAAGDELGDGGDVFGVVVAFEFGDGAFGGLGGWLSVGSVMRWGGVEWRETCLVRAELDAGLGHHFYYVDAVACSSESATTGGAPPVTGIMQRVGNITYQQTSYACRPRPTAPYTPSTSYWLPASSPGPVRRS